jgi:D-alanyl-D-alanine carboxypeptidase
MKQFMGFVMIALLLTACTESRSTTADIEGDKQLEQEDIIHPAFSLTIAELYDRIGSVPPDIRNRILTRPQYFLELIRQMLTLPKDYFLLVDKGHGLSADYIPEDLVPLSEYDIAVNRGDLTLRRAVMPDVLAMNEAARSEGIRLLFSSAYRSYEYQKQVYERHVSRMGKEEADRVSAQPGESQHQLGTTIDFGSITPAFADTDAGEWLKKHAWEFGFSLSYPEGMESLTGYQHEIWHYRYITRTGTRLEQHFFSGIQHHLLTFLHRNRDFFVERRTGISDSL